MGMTIAIAGTRGAGAWAALPSPPEEHKVGTAAPPRERYRCRASPRVCVKSPIRDPVRYCQLCMWGKSARPATPSHRKQTFSGQWARFPLAMSMTDFRKYQKI
jgi:hypothetical protein